MRLSGQPAGWHGTGSLAGDLVALADGIVRDRHDGERGYEQSAGVIQRLLGVERGLVSVEGLGVEPSRAGPRNTRR